MDCWYLPRGLDAPAFRDNPGGFVTSDTAVLDTLVDLTAASVDHSSLPPRDFMLLRLAALIAVDAPPASYLANADASEKSGITADDIQQVMARPKARRIFPAAETTRAVPTTGAMAIITSWMSSAVIPLFSVASALAR